MNEQQHKNEYDLDRQRMLKMHLKERGITDKLVLAAMAGIPREEFVPKSCISQAYSDGPLPIGEGQTISQPYIVALMTQELHLTGDCEVLEIGTGSGYQTAILSKFVKKVYTIERLSDLSVSAQRILARLGCVNIEFHIGDGSIGWPESSLPPSGYFDRIIITAAVPKVPEPLIRQLKDGGLMIVPIGDTGLQELVSCQKREEKLIETGICGVRFVKLFGKYGFEQ